MTKESYKAAFMNIEPDIYLETRLIEKIKASKQRFSLLKKVIISTAIFLLIISGFMPLLLQNTFKGRPDAVAGESGNQGFDNSILSNVPNMFTLVVYAADEADDGYTANTEKTVINDTKITLPDGQIRRKEYNEFVYTQGENAGQTYKGYTAGFSGNICLAFEGENILSVSLSSATGSFNYIDKVKRSEMEKNGELYFARLILGQDLFDSNHDYLSQFKKLWDEGYFDSCKEQYFKNISTNLDDYSVSFNKGVQYDENGNEIPRLTGFFDKEIEVPVHSIVVTIAKKDVHKEYIYMTVKELIIPDYHKSQHNNIVWIPSQALQKVSEYGPLVYEDLPGDTVTISITFINGEVQTKILYLTFDSEGKVIAQLGEAS